MITSMQTLIKAVKAKEKKIVSVAVANDHHVLEAIEKARQEGFIEAILVGDITLVKEALNDLGYAPENYQFVHEIDAVTACEKAVKLVSQNDADFLMKGYVDTAIILRAALDKDYGLRTKNRISHVSVMEIPTYHKLLLMSDGAMNIEPTIEHKQEIIENAVVIAHALGIEKPNVGMIAAVEKVNPKMTATLDAEILVKRNQSGLIEGCTIGGPFALDNAINKEAADYKDIHDPMAGNVDLVIMPQIESGNVFYKSMMFLAKAKSASVIAGAKKPIVLTSRADSMESKYYSIALSALVADLNNKL